MAQLHHKAVPQEAVIFLCAVLVFVLLLVIFFLYLNKSLCFSECGGFPCIDKVPEKNHTLDSDTDDDLNEVQHTSLPARHTKDAPADDANQLSRKSRSRSRVTATDGGETYDGNGASVQDGGKSNLFPGSAASTGYVRLK
ncbi:synaptotagmin-14 [Elysia marginata]|uniref:Synaptotagmin-14 n=1 Tax=Elysia marginata TaxID=1093978 RepID=A0AAV4HMN8_9GAST|nr:synaptotagmin-14 [Elysia marginata]